jgi:CDP-6-deoxy-D-xylo-4-hexulose-3-dehydrase
LNKLAANISARARNFETQLQFFSDYEDWFILPKQMPDSRTGWLAFALTLSSDAPFNRRELQIYLEKRNIQTRTVFTGNILRQPGFANIPCKKDPQGYPNADAVMKGGMLTACHHGLGPEHIKHIQNCFTEFASNYK